MNTIKLTIGGMHCSGCADRIHSLLEKENGVKEISISSHTGKGKVAFGPSSTNEDRIIAIIERAGFTAEKE